MNISIKIGVFACLLAAFGACELKTTPEELAMEAEIGQEFFGSTYSFTYHIRRDFELQASNNTGTDRIRLMLPEIRLGKFLLGPDQYSEATFYRSTLPFEASSSFNKIGKGEVEILQIDTRDSTISGRFWFDASDELNPTNFFPIRGGIFRGVSIRGAFDNPLFTQPFEFRNAGEKLAFRQDQSITFNDVTQYFTLRAKHANGAQMELRFPITIQPGSALTPTGVKAMIGVFFVSENGGDSFQTIKNGTFEMLQNDPVSRVVEARFSLVVQNTNANSEETLTDGYFLFNY